MKKNKDIVASFVMFLVATSIKFNGKKTKQTKQTKLLLLRFFHINFVLVYLLLFFSLSSSPMPTKCHGMFVVPIEECSFAQINEIEGIISNKDINETYIASVTSSLDCLWMIEVKPGWQVRIYNQFDTFN